MAIPIVLVALVAVLFVVEAVLIIFLFRIRK